jgi:Carboxypeptidase regulatory-like domain
MTPRTLGALGLALFLMPAMLAAQAAPQAPGAATPGPAAPRPPMPPRDGTAPAVPSGTGRIRGRVIAAEGGNPLRRAQVRISGNQPGLAATANTDQDGRYEFQNLPAASYSISVTRNGYVSLQFGQQRPFEPGRPLTLIEGQVAEKIDFALPRGGVITGTVVDDLGEPLPGVRVQAQRYVYQPGGARRLQQAGTVSFSGPPTTDDLGHFRVYGLMPGSYVLSAVPQVTGMGGVPGPASTITGSNAGADDGYTTTYYPGTANVEEAQAITVGLAQETNASFAIMSAKMSRISGVVRTSQGAPVGRTMMVMLRTQSGSGTASMGTSILNDGSFVFANVPPGEHFIDVRPTGISASPVAGAAPAVEEFASVPVTTSGQDITGLIITTGAGSTITGRVVFEGNPPPTQAVMQSLRVFPGSADPSSPMVMGFTQDSGALDETGHFQIRGASGRLIFRPSFNAPMPQGWYLKSVTMNGVDITDTGYEPKPSTNITGLEVTLTNQQTSLTGTVTNVRGDAVKDYVVAVFPAAAREDVLATRFTRTIRPDQQGRYLLKGLPPADYVAVAVESLEQGGEWDPAFQQQMRPRGKSFRLTEGQTSTLDLTLVQ